MAFSVAFSHAKADVDLHSAVKKNDVVAVRALLAEGGNANAWVPQGWNPGPDVTAGETTERCTQIATAAQSLEVMRYLVESGANVDARLSNNSGSTTWLRICLAHRRLDMVRYLIDNGATVDAMALKAACEYLDTLSAEDMSMARIRGNRDDMQAGVRGTLRERILTRAQACGAKMLGRYYDTMGARMPVGELFVRGLLDCPTTIDAKSVLAAFTDEEEETAANLSLLTPTNMARFIELGLTNVMINKEPGTLLHAIIKQYATGGSIRRFLEGGNASHFHHILNELSGPRGVTPLMLAAQLKAHHIVQELCELAVDVDICDAAGRTALWYAFAGAVEDCTSQVSLQGSTPSVMCIRYLLQYGANPNITAHGEALCSRSPMHMAFSCMRWNLVDLLLRSGAVIHPAATAEQFPEQVTGAAFSAAREALRSSFLSSEPPFLERLEPPLQEMYYSDPMTLFDMICPPADVNPDEAARFLQNVVTLHHSRHAAWVRRRPVYLMWRVKQQSVQAGAS